MATEEEATLDTIRDLKKKEPFTPFRIVMASGEYYIIDNPEGLVIGGSQLHYYSFRSDWPVHLRLNQITAVDEYPERRSA